MVNTDPLFTSTYSTKASKVFSRTITRQAYLGSLTEVGVKEDAKRVIREVGEAHQIDEVLGVVLESKFLLF